MKRTIILIIFASTLLACSSKEPKPEEPKKPAPKANLKWSERSHEQQEDLMKQVVKPQMAALFKAYDPEVYKAFGCKSCHGKDAKKVHFHMPNPYLPKLDPTDGFAAHKKDDPKTTAFMMDKVTPKMVELLNVEPWSPKNPKGFGCFTCHTRKGG